MASISAARSRAAERPRQWPGMRPQPHRRRRIAIECLALDHLADEPAHRREATPLAGYAKFAGRQVFEIGEDRRSVQRARLDAALAAEF